ncbi:MULTISPECIES: flagellar basal body rod protein FlgC [Cupriavidus]
MTAAGTIAAIARSGMEVEWQRIEVIARNLANAGTTRMASGEAYVPQRLISGPAFMTQAGVAPWPADARPAGGVRIYGIEAMDTQPRLMHEPAHPHADANGNVAYPGIDHAAEMILLIQSQRIYEANVAVYNLARTMYARALEIGSRS